MDRILRLGSGGIPGVGQVSKYNGIYALKSKNNLFQTRVFFRFSVHDQMKTNVGLRSEDSCEIKTS